MTRPTRKAPPMGILMGLGLLCGSLLALVASLGCVGTPLPDPPSARADAMLLVAVPPNGVRLSGADGAIDVADLSGASLRVTIPRLDSRVETSISGAGAFTAELPGALTDTLYLELVDPSGDIFLLAVADGGAMDDAVVVVATADRDGDASPDAIDCAPDDAAYGSLACPTTCSIDSDCALGQACLAGVCAVLTEVCGNGLDDDGDGLIDEDCVACRTDLECAAGQVCTAGFCALP